jgi:hypothetical protein
MINRLGLACPPGPPEYFYEPGEGRFLATPSKSPLYIISRFILFQT